MGFFRRIFGAKKPPSNDKRRWSFSRSTNSSRINDNSKRDSLQSPIANPHENDSDATKHAIAVAAATAVAAEAAIAAAHAAAEVVRLTGGGCDGGSGVGRCSSTRNVRPFQSLVTVELAAVKIQSGFRGYLARRALRALKALVKLQALVRGYIVRKQTADMLRRMQTLVRLQAHARATRTNSSASRRSNSNSFYPPTHNILTGTTYRNRVPYAYASGTGYDGPSILKRCDSTSNYRDIVVLDKAKLGLNWFNNQMNETVRDNQGIISQRNRQNDDEKSVKILEVDTWKPHRKSKQTEGFFQAQQQSLAPDQNDLFFTTLDSPSKPSTEAHNAILHMASAEVSPLTSTIMPLEVNESIIRTTKSSPYGLTTSSRAGGDSARGLFTPTRSECALSLFNQSLEYPNYMANTESSRAKVRSQSAPRQRLEFEKYSRRSLQGLLDTDTISEREFAAKPKIRSKASPPSSRLNRVRSSNLRQ